MAIVIELKNAQKIIPAMRRGIASALNKIMKKAFTESSKQVRKVYNIKARDLKHATKFNKAHVNKASSSFSVEGSRLKLLFFGADDQNPRGVTVRIKKTSGRKRLRSAFVERMPSGHTNVFMRKGPERLPIKSLTTIGTPTMFDAEGEKAVEKTFNNDFPKTLEREIDFKLSQIK